MTKMSKQNEIIFVFGGILIKYIWCFQTFWKFYNISKEFADSLTKKLIVFWTGMDRPTCVSSFQKVANVDTHM